MSHVPSALLTLLPALLLLAPARARAAASPAEASAKQGAAAGASEPDAAPSAPPLPPERGAYANLRLGLGVPLGRFERGAERRALSDVYDFAVPAQLDVGYRFSPALRAGVYFMYAPLSTHTYCPAGLKCRAEGLRAGLAGEYHLAARRRLHGWVGLGLGYERSSVRISGHGVDVETQHAGLEWLGASLGGDYRLTPRLSLGPALTWTFGRYASRAARLGTGSGSVSVQSPALHCWVLFGARVGWAF
ncbi:hypothetical protein FGE12_05235 [Aggregicoccus sp. 17bor-14]|uniref:hypothetical protein n=1 Tax=Myxococcaceae TaxID=31 RepID=UPI00129CEDB3|nr:MULTISPECIES: hypothetical protein [Myxococcaceae]MBF5041784.1 hypothetical protein [Simulacricoccus sp. 17bor-14]MRI87565.1 hypothetical protein [Aggregicoccus sp. 17bor-14]